MAENLKTKSTSGKSKIEFTPGRGKLLVQLPPVEEKTKGGLYLSTGSQDQKSDEGEIVALGPEKINSQGIIIPHIYKAGDKVKFEEYGNKEIEIDEVKYLIIDEDGVLGKFN